jgi:hypothetical protein
MSDHGLFSLVQFHFKWSYGPGSTQIKNSSGGSVQPSASSGDVAHLPINWTAFVEDGGSSHSSEADSLTMGVLDGQAQTPVSIGQRAFCTRVQSWLGVGDDLTSPGVVPEVLVLDPPEVVDVEVLEGFKVELEELAEAGTGDPVIGRSRDGREPHSPSRSFRWFSQHTPVPLKMATWIFFLQI